MAKPIEIKIEGNRIKQLFPGEDYFYRFPSYDDVHRRVISGDGKVVIALPIVEIDEIWRDFNHEVHLFDGASEDLSRFLGNGILSAYAQKPESRQANGIILQGYDRNLLDNGAEAERVRFSLVKYHDSGSFFVP